MHAPSEYIDVAQELYVTYFGRPADYLGLQNMTAALAAANAGITASAINQQYKTNSTVHTLIDSFGTSAESAALYTGDNTQFVTAIYQNLFNRAPDLPGLTFWINAIVNGSETRASAAQAIMAGALQNTSTQGLADAAMINNKVAIANNFTTAIDTAGEVNAYNGNSAAAVARTMLHQVDAHTSTVLFQPKVVATLQSLVMVPGAIVTLTSGVDNTATMVTPGNDLIATTASNLQIADVVVGGDGADTLQITVDNNDYSASDQLAGTKKVEVHASSVEVLKVTDRTTLVQNPSAAGTAQDTNFDGIVGGQTHNADTSAKTGGARDSDTVDTVFAMTLDRDITRIESLSSEVNGSAVTFNDIQKINVGTADNPDSQINPLEIRVEDTGSAHNFIFDEQAGHVGGNDRVTLELSEARDLTINFGETPAGQLANNTLPMSTPFANAKNPTLLGENQNDGQGTVNSSPDSHYYGFAATAQSKIDTLLIDSQVRGPAGVRQVFRNEVLDLNVGTELKTLNITGAAQLKVGLGFTVEQALKLEQSTTTIPVANANPDTSAPVVAGPAPYSYGVLPAVGFQSVVPNVLRDFALTKAAYSLDDNIRNVDASTHYAGVDQAARDLLEKLPVADLTLDFSNGTTDNSVANDKFTYSGSQGDDLINFGVRTINKDIRLNAGNDTVVAGRGQDTIRGGVGDDVIKHNNAPTSNVLGGETFAAGASVTVYGGAGNDQVMTAGQTTEGQINLIDLGTGNDTLYVDDNVSHDGAANHRIAGGLGADQIVITTAGMIEREVPEVFDNVIYADVAPGVDVGDAAEHLASQIVAPPSRSARESFETAGRVANANFIADSYFVTAQAGGTADSDIVVITDSSNNYVNLGNGNNSYVHGDVGSNLGLELAGEPGELRSPGRNSDTVDSGNGIDVIGIYTDGIKQVDTRGGDDVITLKGHGNVTVKAGDGNDDVVINSVSTTQTGNQPANYIDLGAGDDTLLISSKGVINGLTEIYGREGRDVVSILNADQNINTNHTLYVDLGVGADVLELRDRDLMNDDTVFAGNDGSIDQLILRNLNSGSLEYVTASDSARTNGFELIDLRDAGAGLPDVAQFHTPDIAVLGVGGIQLTVTQHLVAQVDSQVTVGDVTAYVYGVRDVHVLPSDGANQDIAVDGEIDNDGLFAAGILGNDTSYMATGVLTITTVEHGVNDADFIIESNNDYALTQTVDLRSMGVDSYVNFLGGTARDVVVVDEASMNSFSNLRFDEFSIDTRLVTRPWIIDEDNSTLDTLRVVVNNDTNDVADISFGDYRNVQGLDAIVLSSNDDVHAANFRIEASAFLVNQTTSVLVPGANNAFGTAVHGLLVTVEDGDVATVYSSATGVSVSLLGGSIVPGTIANDFVTVDGTVDIIAVGAHEFLIADHNTVV